jgi:protein gp37
MSKALTRYTASEKALAAATTITEVSEVCTFNDGLRHAARKIKDRDAEFEAAALTIRAQRKLGEMMIAASKADALAKGTRGDFAGKKRGGLGRGVSGGVKKPHRKEPTLAGAGIDKNLAKTARKLGRLKPDEFKQQFAAWERTVVNGGGERITTKLPEPPKDERRRSAAKVRANNVSLKEWEGFSVDERREFLQPHNFQTDAHFNKQDSGGIEWAQWSWNPVTGCRHDCPYCYARDIAEHYRDAFPHGFEPAFLPYMLNAPRNTKVPDEAAADTRYKNVFTCSMADLFGRWVPTEWIKIVLDTVRENQQWNFLFLTKFPKRMAEFDIPSNAWMGTTVDLQARISNAEAAFSRLNADAGIRWLSIEPMLEPLKFTRLDLFNWIVIGGASKSSKTPGFHPPLPWIIDLYAAAKAAGCAVYMKTNLLGNRVLELPFDAPIKTDATEAPSVFHYLGGKAAAA